MNNLQSLPPEPVFIDTANASDLASAITLVNAMKANLNTFYSDILIPLLGELNQLVTDNTEGSVN